MTRIHIQECHCAACREFDAIEQRFDEWIRKLDEDVIQGEYGYERGEFTVYPSLWRQLFNEGLTPGQAWRRALQAFGEQHQKDERAKQENWERIQRADAALTSEKRNV